VSARSRFGGLFVFVAWWLGAIAVALALGAYAQPVIPGMPPGVRLLPRISPVPTDLPTLLSQLGVGSTFWYLAAAVVPLVVLGARHLDLERHRLRSGAVIAAVVVTVVTLIVATAAIEFVVVYGSSPYRPPFISALVAGARTNALPWLAVAGTILAIETRRRAVRASLERERLRAEVAEQRIIALTSQLQPHFLFNTLQSISTLIHRDPAAADEMLTKLSDLLRDVLRHRDRALVPLGEELRFTRTYLDIAKIRFGDRLSFQIDVAPELHDVPVPIFLLQPLVENALKHGLGARIRGGSISIAAERAGDRIRIDVADDGPAAASIAEATGIGLTNTRERLAASFGAHQSFTLMPRPGGGALARLTIPFASTPIPASNSASTSASISASVR
jgi:two-component system LytT family sensor kinase